MQLAKILTLVVLLIGGAKGSIAVETSLPLPTSVPLEASITGTNDAQSDRAIHTFAMACGLLAFAAAAQQALSHRRPSMARVRSGKD